MSDKNDKPRSYEMVVLLNNTVSPSDAQSFFNSIATIGDGTDLSIDSHEYVGLCRLSYPIKKSNSSHIYLVNIKLTPDLIPDLNAKLKISEFLLRHIIVEKTEKSSVSSFIFKKESEDEDANKVLISKDQKYSISIKKS